MKISIENKKLKFSGYIEFRNRPANLKSEDLRITSVSL